MYKTHREDALFCGILPNCFVIENKFVTLQAKIYLSSKKSQ